MSRLGISSAAFSLRSIRTYHRTRGNAREYWSKCISCKTPAVEAWRGAERSANEATTTGSRVMANLGLVRNSAYRHDSYEIDEHNTTKVCLKISGRVRPHCSHLLLPLASLQNAAYIPLKGSNHRNNDLNHGCEPIY
jgi:hypothetical protein